MSGTAVVLGNGRSPYSTYMQVAGRAQRIGVEEFRGAIDGAKELQHILFKFVQAFSVQTAHTAIANARATVEERLARWLLMAHDRIDGDELLLTHEFLALMLGVRRAGVTVAIHALESRALIQSGRGHIWVLDRKGLEETAGGYYGTPESEYRRLMN
jgi:CRP-like cAMP-binding protein